MGMHKHKLKKITEACFQRASVELSDRSPGKHQLGQFFFHLMRKNNFQALSCSLYTINATANKGASSTDVFSLAKAIPFIFHLL